MFRNVLAATLRNLARNRLYAAISICGLALGMAAAILTAVFIRDELSFDHFIPGHETVYVVASEVTVLGTERQTRSIAQLASWLKLDFPEIVDAERQAASRVAVRRGEQEAAEVISWVDPGFFRLMPYPTYAGDLASALDEPDAVVLTRSMARKYFGTEAAVGRTLEFDRRRTFRVSAVIEDPSSGANITAEIFASSRSPFSPLAQADAQPYSPGGFNNVARTYLRLKSPAAFDTVLKGLPGFVARRLTPPQVLAMLPPGSRMELSLVPVDRIHLIPDQAAATPPSSPQLLYGLGAIASLVLLIAGANFANLMTARGGRRALEVGVRKAVGAERRHLALQFIGEAMVYALAALLAALALVELLLPALEGLVLRKITVAYWRDPALLGFLAGLALLTGIAAGAYPALVLSAFRPRVVLKGGLPQTTGSAAVRQALVAGQFAVLILLVFGVLVIQRQTRFAMTEAVAVDKSQLLRIALRGACGGLFVEAVRAAPGVASVTCGSSIGFGNSTDNRVVDLPGGGTMLIDTVPVGFGFLEQLGVHPLAGRLPGQAYGEDSRPRDGRPGPCFSFGEPSIAPFPNSVTANETLARSMGGGNAAAVVGKTLRMHTSLNDAQLVRIAGVTPDFGFDLTRGPIKPAIFYVAADCLNEVSVKIAPGRLGEALPAIDRLWGRLGEPRPIRRQFVDDYLRAVYAGVVRQGTILTALSAVAVFIAGLGLFGLAAFTAERRTKEIGVRKAMGASSPDIVRLLLWSFTQPVLWANLIAWPVGWWAMSRWLQGFSARIELSPLYFLAAGAAALLIAALTVSAHAIRVARAKPVGALRYE